MRLGGHRAIAQPGAVTPAQALALGLSGQALRDILTITEGVAGDVSVVDGDLRISVDSAASTRVTLVATLPRAMAELAQASVLGVLRAVSGGTAGDWAISVAILDGAATVDPVTGIISGSDGTSLWDATNTMWASSGLERRSSAVANCGQRRSGATSAVTSSSPATGSDLVVADATIRRQGAGGANGGRINGMAASPEIATAAAWATPTSLAYIDTSYGEQLRVVIQARAIGSTTDGPIVFGVSELRATSVSRPA